MESTAWPCSWPLWSGRKLGDLVRLLTHLGVASDTWKKHRSPDLWHLLGDPEQKERGEDLKHVLCQDAYRETRSSKYSWAEMTKQQPLLFLFLWENCLHEKFPPELDYHPVSANSSNVQDLKVLGTRALICSDRMCLQIQPKKCLDTPPFQRIQTCWSLCS